MRTRANVFFVAGLVTAALAVLPAAPAVAAVGCGDSVTTSVTLTADLICPGGPGLIVTGDDVVVDLGGHTVGGSVSTAAFGIEVTGDNVAIRNGTVRDFDKNVVFSGVVGGGASDLVTRNGEAGVIVLSSSGTTIDRLDARRHGEAAVAVTGSTGVTVTDVVIRSGGHGILVANSFGTDVARADIRRALFGVYASGGSNGTVVGDSRIVNSEIGIISEGSTKTQVATSRVARNRVGVLYLLAADGGIVRDSRIVRNTVGVQVGDPATDATGPVFVRHNVARNNGAAGILVDVSGAGGLSLSLEENRVRSNGFTPSGVVDSLGQVVDDGIHSVSGIGEVVVGGNSANDNADLGIEAVGATDGGGNTATGNGNAAQCTGVAC